MEIKLDEGKIKIKGNKLIKEGKATEIPLELPLLSGGKDGNIYYTTRTMVKEDEKGYLPALLEYLQKNNIKYQVELSK